MRNRAKCLLCNQVIESVSRHDYVLCKCGEIAVDGGQEEYSQRVFAKDWDNFRIVLDDGTEVKIKRASNCIKACGPDDIPEQQITVEPAPTKDELLSALAHLSNVYKDLPQGAKMQPVTHSDLHSFLDIVLALFRAS